MLGECARKTGKMTLAKCIKVVVGSAVFGVLMAMRTELHGLWMRAGVAAVAAAVLALAFVGSARCRPT